MQDVRKTLDLTDMSVLNFPDGKLKELDPWPERPWLQRLAYFTLVTAPETFPWHVNVTKPEEIDCSFEVTDAEMKKYHDALDCYATYAEVIAKTGIHDVFRKDVHFEIFRENHEPPLPDLFAGLKE